MFKKAPTKPFKFDFDVYTGGKLDKKKIAQIDSDVIDLTYDNGIALIKEIIDDIKTIGARTTWLLGILVVIVLALASFLLRDFFINVSLANQEISEAEKVIKATIKFLYIIYLSSIAICGWPLMASNFGKKAHNSPENILTKDTFSDDAKSIKIREIQKIASKVDTNKKELDKLAYNFKKLMIFFILALPYSFILAILFVFSA